jgi:hypothetical protein
MFKQNGNGSNVNDAKKKFCKICFDAKKKEAEYTSHYVKDLNTGKITCPYLLFKVVCGFCKKKEGHTTKNCPLLIKKNGAATAAKDAAAKDAAAKDAAAKEVDAKHADAAKHAVVKTKAKLNPFNALRTVIDQEENELLCKEKIEKQNSLDFPTLSVPQTTKNTTKLTGWAKIVQGPGPCVVPTVVVPTVVVPTVVVPTVVVPTVVVPYASAAKPEVEVLAEDEVPAHAEPVKVPAHAEVEVPEFARVSSIWADE